MIAARFQHEGASVGKRSWLEDYAVIRTNSVDELRKAVSSIYGDHSFDVRRGVGNFYARANHCSLGNVGLCTQATVQDVGPDFHNSIHLRSSSVSAG